MQRRWQPVPSLRCYGERRSAQFANASFTRHSYQHSIATRKPLGLSRYSSRPWTLGNANQEADGLDTIYGLSTAPGRAAIAVVRISGPACGSIYAALCPNRPPLKPRTATLRSLHHPNDSNQVLDPSALLLSFRAPNTVTGEDVLEFHVHGGPAIVRSVLNAISKCQVEEKSIRVRPAEAGEFTKRAFYNHRIDLTQAEALGESLTAETEQQRRLATSGSSNVLAKRYEEWRNILLHARGELEALIDFSEDQHFDESPRDFIRSVTNQVVQLRAKVQIHVDNAVKGELLRNGINVALLGAPNAGKSSLLNLIVGREAAIVSAEEGTTRDIVDISIDLGGWLVNLGDMAGLRSSTPNLRASTDSTNIGSVEREGIRRARERALQSDLVIVFTPLQRSSTGLIEWGLNDELVSAIDQCRSAGKELVFVVNKIDLLQDQMQLPKKSLSSFLCKFAEIFPDVSANDVFCVSCKDARIDNPNELDPGGIQTLLSGLAKKFSMMTTALTGEGGLDEAFATDNRSYWSASLCVTHRQKTYLQDCLTHLDDFLTSTDATAALPITDKFRVEASHHIDDHVDLVAECGHFVDPNSNDKRSGSEIDIVAAAEHLRYAADCLARITGKAGMGDVEDVLGVVFEK